MRRHSALAPFEENVELTEGSDHFCIFRALTGEKKHRVKNLPLVSLVCLLILLPFHADAQYFGARSTYWKNQRHTISFGIGAANFLGELGGRDQVGSDFIWDLEISKTRPALMVNYRYQLGSRFFARAQFSFGYIAGNDALTNEIFRRNRNLHFRSPVAEMALMFEAKILDFKPKTRYYTGVKKSGLDGWSLSAIAGVGYTYFNPQANLDGVWYNLQPLHTEGQGLPGAPDPYSRFTAVVPLGFRIEYELNKEWSFGFELIHRITFTDYMDDVSGVYYDNAEIALNYGDLAAYFADPSLGYFINSNGDQVPLNSTRTGDQRGNDEDNDAYMMAHFTATYTFNQKRFRRTRGRITKRRARRVVF